MEEAGDAMSCVVAKRRRSRQQRTWPVGGNGPGRRACGNGGGGGSGRLVRDLLARGRATKAGGKRNGLMQLHSGV